MRADQAGNSVFPSATTGNKGPYRPLRFNKTYTLALHSYPSKHGPYARPLSIVVGLMSPQEAKTTRRPGMGEVAGEGPGLNSGAFLVVQVLR